MTHVFIVMGYGVPNDIDTDENMGRYLSMCRDEIIDSGVEDPMVIFCGGLTDMYEPYKRNEADELKGWFERNSGVNLDGWKLISEKESISTLENLINARNIIDKENVDVGTLTIFCEWTRRGRVRKIADALDMPAAVIPLDFDESANRYRDEDFLADKEAAALALDMQAIEDPESMKRHHQLYADKLAFYREKGADLHEEAIYEWWQMALDKFNKGDNL